MSGPIFYKKSSYKTCFKTLLSIIIYNAKIIIYNVEISPAADFSVNDTRSQDKVPCTSCDGTLLPGWTKDKVTDTIPTF